MPLSTNFTDEAIQSLDSSDAIKVICALPVSGQYGPGARSCTTFLWEYPYLFATRLGYEMLVSQRLS
ncbi:hypothetical protein VTJ04DRAFT_3942 [Mycothermus thermophilus]|uniref:uncharacterized protein n=1 Tax=Humicola insolens TaxID=85995 RepID=UPI0037449BC9